MNARRLSAWAALCVLPGCYTGFSADANGPGAGQGTGATSGADSAGGSGGESGDEDEDETGGGDDGTALPGCVDVGPRLMRRLTGTQLRNTLEDIFEANDFPEAQVLTDPVVHGFKVDAYEANIRDLGAQQVMQFAESVADWAVSEKLQTGWLPCQTTDESCTSQIIEELGLAFHREPLDEALVEGYRDIVVQEDTFEDGVRQLISAMIQSPYFLYRRELGSPDAADADRYVLTDYELASNLSYSLTGHPPDDTLMGLAAEGVLHEDAELVAQVSRLVSSPGGQETMAAFVEGWLEVEDIGAQVRIEQPGVDFGDDVRHAMLEETAMFFNGMVQGNASVADLLTAEHTYVNGPLAELYGIPNVSGEGFTRVDVGPGQPGSRAPGLLGQGSTLARHAGPDNSSPVFRGVVVRERLLCSELAEPPSNVDTTLPPIPDGATNRERFDVHRTDPVCASCHTLIDPLGFAFEHYDQFGRWRDIESGQPVDASGEVTGVGEGAIAVDGVQELAEVVSTLPQYTACFTEMIAYYSYGVEACDGESLLEDAMDADVGTMDVLEAIVLSPHFRERVLEAE